jgi:hypothetical protein
MRRYICVVVGALAFTASAAAKGGAMLSPRLLLFGLPAGTTTRVQLDVSSVYSGSRLIVPAPRVGSVPVVTLREIGGAMVMRFVGTPLDHDWRSVVTITVPSSTVTRRWVVSVRASGRAYPDLIDPPVTITANLPSMSAVLRSRPTASGPAGGNTQWPLLGASLVLAAAVGGGALTRARRYRQRVSPGA